MMNLLDYINEIWTVAKVRDVDVGVATDMFLADAQNGEAKPFNTADSLPDLDFAQLKTELGAMSLAEQSSMLNDWREFRTANYRAICDAFAEGEDAVIALVEDWRLNLALRDEEEEPDEHN